MHLDATAALPTRHKAPSVPVTDKVGLQPTRQAVFAAGPYQAISDQHESAIGIRNLGDIVAEFGSAEMLVEDLPEAELIEQGPDEQNRPPVPGIENVHVGGLVGQAWFAAQDAFELGQKGLQEVLATEVGDHALLDLAVLAVGFDDADVLVDGPAGGGNFDRADIHEISITTAEGDGKRKSGIAATNNVTTFSSLAAAARGENLGKTEAASKSD
jgi:hypothetical protein